MIYKTLKIQKVFSAAAIAALTFSLISVGSPGLRDEGRKITGGLGSTTSEPFLVQPCGEAGVVVLPGEVFHGTTSVDSEHFYYRAVTSGSVVTVTAYLALLPDWLTTDEEIVPPQPDLVDTSALIPVSEADPESGRWIFDTTPVQCR